jgi:DNA polymerase III delta prime subunit
MSTAYDKMTRAERRVAIAKDVIKHIKAERLRVQSSYGYVVHDIGWNELTEVIETEGKATKVAEKLKNECTVCARGAMMLCKVAKYNHYEFEKGWGISSESTTHALKDAFSEEQLNLIENAFELNGYIGNLSEKAEWLYEWLYEFSNAEDRLLAIMQNIVDPNGSFKPNAAYEVVG